VLGCTVLKGGHLECAVNSEKPAGLGFGAAAMKLSSLFQMAAKTGDGMATEGVRLSLPMNFRVPRNRARA
jgi:protein TonB